MILESEDTSPHSIFSEHLRYRNTALEKDVVKKPSNGWVWTHTNCVYAKSLPLFLKTGSFLCHFIVSSYKELSTVCVCVCVYMCVCACMHVYVYVFVCLGVSVYMYVCAGIYVQAYVFVCTCVFVYMCVHICISMCTY